MTVLLALVASSCGCALVPVRALNQDTWLGSLDYPQRAIAVGGSGATESDIFVGADSKPEDCTVVVSSGWSDLDVAACAAAMQRGRFEPALGPDGAPMPGVYRFRTAWMLADQGEHRLPPDVSLVVSKLPQGAEHPVAWLTYLVDEGGRITRCAVAKSSGFAVLDSIACHEMPERYRFAPAVDKSGKAWPVVRTQSVGFSVAETPRPDK